MLDDDNAAAISNINNNNRSTLRGGAGALNEDVCVPIVVGKTPSK